MSDPISKTAGEAKADTLPPTYFLVLALLAEEEMHGYKLEQLVHNRGFRFWTELSHSSIYTALKKLEEKKLIRSRLVQGKGPHRKVFALTKAGRKRLVADALIRFQCPSHPRNEIDLSIYSLPFLPRKEALKSIGQGITILKNRLEFIKERLGWCRRRGLRLAMLSFQRPFLSLKAELKWLESLENDLAREQGVPYEMDWQSYEYKEPPGSDFA